MLIITCFTSIAGITVFDVIFPLMADDDFHLKSSISGYIISILI